MKEGLWKLGERQSQLNDEIMEFRKFKWEC